MLKSSFQRFVSKTKTLRIKMQADYLQTFIEEFTYNSFTNRGKLQNTWEHLYQNYVQKVIFF